MPRHKYRIVVAAVLIAAAALALFIRDRDAGFIALQEGRFDRSLEIFTERAAAGDTLAAYFAGAQLMPSFGGNRDVGRAAALFEKSATGGLVSGAVFEFWARAIHLNFTPAICGPLLNVLSKAAETGNTHAQVLLGEVYKEGRCTEPDNAKSAFYYGLAVKSEPRFGEFLAARMAALPAARRRIIEDAIHAHTATHDEQAFFELYGEAKKRVTESRPD